MGAKAWVVAAVVLAGGGYAAWTYYGHGDRGPPADAAGENPKAAVPAPTPDDTTLIASQGYCPVMTDTRLGEMGAPIKLTVTGKNGKEEPVFVCCKGCRRKALADPDKTLATVAALRAAPR